MTLSEDRYNARPWGERLREWREDVKSWSRADLRDQIEAASHKVREARGHRLDVRLIARWESGDVKQPQAVYRRLLACVGAPQPQARTERRALSAAEEDDMDRRRFLRHTGVAVAAAVTAPANHCRSTRDEVDLSHIHELRSAMDDMYRADQTAGSGGLTRSALRLYFDTHRMLDEAKYDDTVGSELTRLAGEIAICVGWLHYDSGDRQTSQSLYAEGLLLAEQSNDTRLSVQAMEKMALQSAHLADHENHRGAARESLRIAERVTEMVSHGCSDRLRALIAGRRAVAHAVNGDGRGFEWSMGQAWQLVETCGPAGPDEAWLEFVNAGEILVHEAKGLRYLGRPTDAVHLYRTSLESEGLSARNRINYECQLAGCLATVGDVRGAVEIGASVLLLLDGKIRSPRSLAELSVVRRSAETAGMTGFCDMYDQISRRGVAA